VTILRNKKYLVVSIIALIVVLLAGFHIYRSNRKVTITLGVFAGSPWGVPDATTYEFINNAIAEFEKNNPNVHVEYVSGIPREDYSEWLACKIVEGKAPDVYMILPEDFSTLQNVGALRSLDGLVKKDQSFSKDVFYEGAYDSGNTAGKQYALPMESAPDIMFVNKTLLAKENISMPDNDWTWAEFYSICRKVTKDTDNNGVLDQFGEYNYTWKHAFITNDVELFDDKSETCNILGDNAIEAVEHYKKIKQLKQGAVVTANDFDMGNVAFMPLSLAEYRTYKPYPWSIKKYSNFNWDCITLPRGPQGENSSRMNTLLLGMNNRTHEERLSWELMKTFCCNEEIQLQIYKYREGAAVNKHILNQENALLIENQALPKSYSMNVTMIDSILNNAKSDNSFKDSGDMIQIISKGINEVVDNDTNPEISLKKIQRELNQR